MDISDFYSTFFEEAEELLGDMEAHLLALDVDNPDMEQLNAIFRAAHSIKGGWYFRIRGAAEDHPFTGEPARLHPSRRTHAAS